MGYNKDVGNQMDTARELARKELQKELEGMTPKQKEGARYVMNWVRRNYRYAGYKRCSRVLIDEVS